MLLFIIEKWYKHGLYHFLGDISWSIRYFDHLSVDTQKYE